MHMYYNVHTYTIHIYESADSVHCTVIIRQPVAQPGDVPPRTRCWHSGEPALCQFHTPTGTSKTIKLLVHALKKLKR